MTVPDYPAKATAILLVDPYNDFLSEGGKLWPRVKDIAEKVSLIENLKAIVADARKAGLKIFFVPHHRWQEGDYIRWKSPTPYQMASNARQTFAKGTWGGTFHPDFQMQPGDLLISEHWGSSGFANTDLDHQLKQYGIDHIICVGMIANTCIEATARFGMELGYHVTLVTDATSAFSEEAMHAAHKINGPTFAHAILTTVEVREAIAKASYTASIAD
jgi:nicotinamidase-related amidase